MSLSHKEKLIEKLGDLAPRYNMENISLPSFEKNYGYLTTLSATDVVYSTIALLDCGASWLEKHGSSYYEGLVGKVSQNDYYSSNRSKNDIEDSNDSGDVGLVGAGVGTRTLPGQIAGKVLSLVGKGNDTRSEWVRHFYLAYDALEK